jgi:hypothetical protein
MQEERLAQAEARRAMRERLFGAQSVVDADEDDD